jgi:thermitase
MRSGKSHGVETLPPTRSPHPKPLTAYRGFLAGVVFFLSAEAHPDGATGAERSGASAPAWAEGRILVVPRAGLPSRRLDDILKKGGGMGVQRIKRLRALGVHVVKVPPRLEDFMARALSRNPHIAIAAKDARVQRAEVVPNDPAFKDAWHLLKIQAPKAWEASTGDGVVIAILDSGVDGSHPDLSGKLLPGYNVVSNNGDTSPIDDHGTAVAGVAAAAGNNGVGVPSVAWNARILPVRITNTPGGTAYTSDIAAAISWAADYGADVANISYPVTGNPVVDHAAQYMRSKGGIVVAAAGNIGADANVPNSAAVISVSATGRDDARTSWSSYGDYIDVAAPGEDIPTTVTGGGYGGASGTSFASPQVAGVVALIRSVNRHLSPDQIEALLEQSADDPVSGSDWHPHVGYGRINAASAVRLALDAGPTDNEPPVAALSSPVAGAHLKGLQAIEVGASDNTGVSRVALYAGATPIGVDTSAPYQFSWDTTAVTDGMMVLTARAYDAAGNEGSSPGVPVVIDNASDGIAPAVVIDRPKNGKRVSGRIAIVIRASDDSGVTATRLFIDGLPKSTVDSANLEYRWDTRKARRGKHLLRAEAYDAAGNKGFAAIHVVSPGTSRAGKKHGKR